MSGTPAIHRFCRLPIPSYEQIFADANTILDEIISQFHSYRKPNQAIDTKEVVSFLSHGCGILQNATILLKSKFAQIINLYMPKIKNLIEESCVNDIVMFLCQSMRNSKSSLVSEFMRALSVTLSGMGPILSEEVLLQLLDEDGIFWMYLTQNDWIVKGYTLQCIGNICIRSSNGDLLEKQYTQMCYSKLLDTLRIYLLEDTGDVEQLKLINIALKALQNVLSGISVNEGMVEPEFAVTLLKIFLAYGIPGYRVIVERLIKVLPSRKIEDTQNVQKIYPTKKKEKSPMTKKVHAKRARRKKKNTNSVDDSLDGISEDNFNTSFGYNWRHASQSPSSSSESEYSDSESGQRDHVKSILLRIRQNAAVSIQGTLRCCDQRSKFSCWLILVPDSISDNDPNLLHSLAMEMSPKIRSSILIALMELIDGSKGFLDSVVNVIHRVTPITTVSSKSFTPFSVKLNHSIHILHDTLLTTLHREQTDIEKDKVIKCLTLLMLNSPYRKIGIDYLPDIIRNISYLIHAKEIALVQSILTCLAASMSVDATNQQVLKLLISSRIPSKNDDLVGIKGTVVDSKQADSWLTTFCLEELSVAAKDEAKELRLTSECIQLMTVVLRCHPKLIKSEQRDKLIDLCIHVFLFHTDATISYHTIKLLEEVSKYFASNYLISKDGTEGNAFWKKMLSGAIPQYLHIQPEKPIKGQAAICDWVSNIGSFFFQSLKNPNQIFIKTILIGLASSEHPLLSAAAVRALGVIIDYECMKEDVWFVVDVTRAILQQLDNPSVNVRLKAAWSLANLCDFIDQNGFLVKEYPESMIIQLFEYATKAALDNDKVSSNGVRALGNILKHFPKKLYEKECFVGTIRKSVEALIKNITTGPMKTRWNACYACRYMLENVDCPLATADWASDLFNSLLKALGECKNFKVRISAASALYSPSSRSCYGDEKLFVHIWKECLLALEKSDELTDFTEFKHKDNLQEQTMLLLLHLLSVATSKDMSNMRPDVQQHTSIFVLHCEKCIATSRKNDDDIDTQSQHSDTTTSSNTNHTTTSSNTNHTTTSSNNNHNENPIGERIQRTVDNLSIVCNIDKTLAPLDIIKTALHLAT